MTAIIFNSRAYKFAKSLAAGLVNAWNHSLLGRLNVFITLCYEKSLSKRIWLRFYSVENTVANSLYGALLKKARGFLFILGDVLRQSLFYRFIIFIRNVYFKATAGSIIFSLLHRLGLRQWLLLAFTLYLPLDYFFRTKVTIAIVASLWEELFIMAAALLILWRKALKQSGAIGRETPLDCYILLFMSVGLLLMSVVNPHPAIALAGYRATVEYMIWFFLIIRLIENEKDLKIIFGGILTVGILLGFHGIYQYIIGVPIPASWVTKTEMGVRTRVFSLTGSPNILGSLMVMIAPMSAALIYYCKKIVNKIFFTLTTGAMCLCLLFTFSRGAWVGMVVAVIIFALFIDKRLLGVMGAGLASALIFVPSITSRLTYLFTSDYAEASAVGGRTLRWETGRLLLMENNPWLGFGLGRFGGAVAMNNKILEETEEFSYFYMDNYYLKTMVEMGYIGIIVFLLLIAGLLIWGIRAVYHSDVEYVPGKDQIIRGIGNARILSAGIISGLSGVLAHCYFENIFEEPYMMAYFWGLAAMLMYLGFIGNKKISDC